MVSTQFTTLSVEIFFIFIFYGFFVVVISLAIIAVLYCLVPIWTRVIIPVLDRLAQIAERRARERAPQDRDVTIELATAPGEFYP